MKQGVKVTPLWVTQEGTPCAQSPEERTCGFPTLSFYDVLSNMVALVTQAALLLCLPVYSCSSLRTVPDVYGFSVYQFVFDFYCFCGCCF